MSEYWAQLPEETREILTEIGLKYRGMVPGIDHDGRIPDYATAVELLEWQHLETEILGAHGDWLAKVKASIERAGREYNRETFLRYCALREHE